MYCTLGPEKVLHINCSAKALHIKPNKRSAYWSHLKTNIAQLVHNGTVTRRSHFAKQESSWCILLCVLPGHFAKREEQFVQLCCASWAESTTAVLRPVNSIRAQGGAAWNTYFETAWNTWFGNVWNPYLLNCINYIQYMGAVAIVTTPFILAIATFTLHSTCWFWYTVAHFLN